MHSARPYVHIAYKKSEMLYSRLYGHDICVVRILPVKISIVYTAGSFTFLSP